MDSMRGQFSDLDSSTPDFSDDDDAGVESPPVVADYGDRRMQVRAYNFWASLLDNRTFPDVSALRPDELGDFGPFSVLLDFTDGIDNPRIAYLGSQLAEECGIEADIRRLDEVPSRSLLSRITDHYMQILANQAPIGFEAEFINQRGGTILYRGILLPFARDDETIDHIYGVINWKELADQSTTDALMKQVEEAVEIQPLTPRESAPMNEWADGPADIAVGRADDAHADSEPLLLDMPLAEFGMQADEFIYTDRLAANTADAMSLGDWLAVAREEALNARKSEDRSRQALYEAIGRAHDFALAAAAMPEDFAALLADAGIKAQERAPLIPLVKLVFGADYDKTRLTEFATVIAHAQRMGLGRGMLAPLLAATTGGVKALVREERRLRREESGKAETGPSRHDQLAAKLRRLEPRSFDSVKADSEFAVLIARRLEDGRLVLLGEVADDPALLDRAARRLLG